MDAGSLVEAFVGNNVCRIVRRDKSRAECVTLESALGEAKVRVRFDNGIRSFDDYKYLFVEDPRIVTVASGQHAGPKGVPAGGIGVKVTGENLNSVLKPLMFVEVEGVKYNSSCVVEADDEMKCKSPAVPVEKLSRLFSDMEAGDPIELHYGFIMDGVKSVQSLTTRAIDRLPKLLMFPNPVYLNFSEPNGLKYYKSDYLTINVSILSSREGEADLDLLLLLLSLSVSARVFAARDPGSQSGSRLSRGRRAGQDRHRLLQRHVPLAHATDVSTAHLAAHGSCLQGSSG